MNTFSNFMLTVSFLCFSLSAATRETPALGSPAPLSYCGSPSSVLSMGSPSPFSDTTSAGSSAAMLERWKASKKPGRFFVDVRAANLDARKEKTHAARSAQTKARREADSQKQALLEIQRLMKAFEIAPDAECSEEERAAREEQLRLIAATRVSASTFLDTIDDNDDSDGGYSDCEAVPTFRPSSEDRRAASGSFNEDDMED